MQLNIYILSHPIIQRLSRQFICPAIISQETSNNNAKQLGMLIFYEALRKWLKIQNIYIKQIDYTKESYITETKESYIILTNLLDTYNLITDAINLFAKVELKHVHLNKKINESNNNYYHNIINKNFSSSTKFIIFYPSVKDYNIIWLLNYLILQKHVKISQIKILCITCNYKVLEQIGCKYPKLNIYTTRIMQQ